jgi:hypothetical protein
MTLEQVGQIIGVTKERVRQIQNKALEKIRGELESAFLGAQRKDEKGEGEEGASNADANPAKRMAELLANM